MDKRRIIFVPGKNPKPMPDVHRRMLLDCLLEGLRRADCPVAAEIARNEKCFTLVSWNHAYYGQYSDGARDEPWLKRLRTKTNASPEDIREAQRWNIRGNALLYSIADIMPCLIRWLPGPAVATVNETRRYFNNTDNVAYHVREILKKRVRPLLDEGQQVLLIGHSLGSVIAWDALWELTHIEHNRAKLDFMSLGSPLGMRFVQHRMLGHQYAGERRYTANIRRWVNMSSVGDITALDKSLADDFAPMLGLGLLESIEDHSRLYNYFRNEEGLNVHRSYGYLVNELVGRQVAAWWQEAAARA